MEIIEPIETKETQPEKKKKSPFLRFAVDAFIYVVIVGGIVFGLPHALAWSLKTAYPMAAITSGSMWPVLKEGDLVFVQGVKGKGDIRVGDIVVYRNMEKNLFVIHRVVALGEKTLTTKGDANFGPDAPVPYNMVVGKTFQIFGNNIRIPYLGVITVYANKKINTQ